LRARRGRGRTTSVSGGGFHERGEGTSFLSVLVLNASYECLASPDGSARLCLIFAGKAEMLEETSDSVRSPSMTIPLPSVIRMRYYVRKPHMMVPFSRTNAFLRDRYTCQYCGRKPEHVRTDTGHVLPKSHGGEACWENVVTACKACNARKGNRTLEEAKIAPDPAAARAAVHAAAAGRVPGRVEEIYSLLRCGARRGPVRFFYLG